VPGFASAPVAVFASTKPLSKLGWFWRRHRGMCPETIADVIELRDELQEIWTGKMVRAQKILIKWLRWRPTAFHQQALARLGMADASDYTPFDCSLVSRKLVPNYSSLRSLLVQGVFEHWGHFAYCANKDCAAPYFISKRKDQTVCDSEACKAERQREHALKWWTENRARKTSKKGRSKDGARKKR
jgi:hypothetical protein